MPGLLHKNDLVLVWRVREDLKGMVGIFVEVCRRSSLKDNANKTKLAVFGGGEGFECEINGWDAIGVSVRVQIFGACIG